MTKALTIWIPTYRRLGPLRALRASLREGALLELAKVIVSDNDPESDGEALVGFRALGVGYRRNSANLTAGVNFLRAFECCTTEWLMIVGDDYLSPPVRPRF